MPPGRCGRYWRQKVPASTCAGFGCRLELPSGFSLSTSRSVTSARTERAKAHLLSISRREMGEAFDKNRRTLLREAEEALGRTRDPNEVVDMLHVIEESATHFFLRAKMGKNAGRRTEEIDEDYKQAAALAALAAPHRHARLSAMKLVGDPNNPARIRDDASLEELRAEMMKHMGILIDGGLIDLEALLAEKRRTAN
jgi:hypothetical protein